MSNDFFSLADRPGELPPSVPDRRADQTLPAAIPSAESDAPTAVPAYSALRSHIHPLDRAENDPRIAAAEATRIHLAWAKLVWLLSFLAVLLAISYLVPFIAEQE